MNKKFNVSLLAITTANFLFCLSILIWLFVPERKVFAQEPPQDFLGSIYYGSNPVTAVFDHELPYLSVVIPGDPNPDDGNTCTRHYDGNDCNPNPQNGFGYDEHDGIDYGLDYEPVLAAADGTVNVAGWADPSDHTSKLGLFVRIEHDDENNYITEYGHLSVLQVQTGDLIVANPDNRQGIIGISGSTGNSTGPHLHFGLINPNGVRVNPYGWRGSPVQDPWELDPRGAISHDVWIDEPSISTAQFDDGDEIVEPPVNNARMIIDDASADFITAGPCTWNTTSGDNSAYNQVYHRILSDISGSCTATWFIQPDAFTPAGEYDVFAHIPNDDAASFGVEYTIQHNGQTSVAVIVQAAYLANNTEHDAWAYLGRYDFAMEPFFGEYIRLDSQTVVSDTNTYVLADAIMLAPAEFTSPPGDEIYVSFASDGMAGNIPYADEDILAYDPYTDQWSLVFDGSDVGLAERNVDGFDFQEGKIYLSLSWLKEKEEKTQVYRFSPTSLGAETVGEMQEFFVNGELLDKEEEDVDGFGFAPGGSYLFSTNGLADIEGVKFDDEDVFAFTQGISSGQFGLYWDGTAVALTAETEDINGLWLDPLANKLYLTAAGPFSTQTSNGDGADIFTCNKNGACDRDLYWNGSAHGLSSVQVNGLSLTPFPVCTHFTNGGFEQQFRCWDTSNDEYTSWSPTTEEAYNGQFSAKAEAWTNRGIATLASSPIQIDPNTSNTKYNFAFDLKTSSSVNVTTINLYGHAVWYQNSQVLGSDTLFTINLLNGPEDWTLFSSDFVCPPPGADSVRWELQYYLLSLSQDASFVENAIQNTTFVDDISYASQSGSCPVH